MIITNTNDLALYKLIILFICNEVKLPVSRKHMTDIVITGNLMNYFYLPMLLDSLLDDELVDLVDEGYILSIKGTNTLDFIGNKIPKGIKKYICVLAKEFKPAIKNEISIKAAYLISDDEDHIAHLKIVDGFSPLIDLKISAGSEKEAKKICKSFKENTDSIYSEILNILQKERD